MITTDTEPRLARPLWTVLNGIKSRVVVVGSVARGVRWPKDLDLLWDLDSAPAKAVIERHIRYQGLEYESPFIGCWTFRKYGWMVEILCTHHGPDYRTVRRRARKETILGIDFWVARPEDAPKSCRHE